MPRLPEEAAREIFFPRPDMPFGPPAAGAWDHLFEVDGETLRLRIFPGPEDAPSILFFHGNGETARDYDHAADYFRALPCTLLAAEYRGYGPCSGAPSMNTFLDDAAATLDEALDLLSGEGRRPDVAVMGRSLGSAPAIHLAATAGEEIGALIVESGFALTTPLLDLIGIDPERMGITEEQGPGNLDKMRTVSLPALIIHAERDELLPVGNAELLGEAAAGEVELLRVPGAGHNDILAKAGAAYFEAIGRLLGRAFP